MWITQEQVPYAVGVGLDVRMRVVGDRYTWSLVDHVTSHLPWARVGGGESSLTEDSLTGTIVCQTRFQVEPRTSLEIDLVFNKEDVIREALCAPDLSEWQLTTTHTKTVVIERSGYRLVVDFSRTSWSQRSWFLSRVSFEPRRAPSTPPVDTATATATATA